MKIGIMGASCSGKSTLLKALHEKYPNYCTISEIASNYTIEQRNEFGFQYDILRQQIAAERDLASFFSDRTVLDNLAYCGWYYREKRYSEPEVYHACLKLVDEHLRHDPYDVIFFIDDYFYLEDNGIRLIDIHQQAETFRMMKNIISLYSNLYDINYYDIIGSTEERIKIIERRITL